MTLIVTIVAFAGLMAMMSVGVLIGGRRLRGSCGGVGGEDCICDETGKPILMPDCDDDFHACEKDPATCSFAIVAGLRNSLSGLSAGNHALVRGWLTTPSMMQWKTWTPLGP